MRYYGPTVTTFDAILPAGGTIDPNFAARVGVDAKALIEIGGRTIFDRTLDALERSGRVARTVVIGTPDVLAHPSAQRATYRLESGPSGPQNILNGLKHLRSQENPPKRVLVVTTDLPFLTAEIIERFIDACPPDKDICVPLITKSQYQSRFPNSGATFIPLRDDTWTAGCAYLMNAEALEKSTPHIERVFANRKSKIGMAKLLGFGFLLKVIMKTLTAADAEKKIVEILGCSAKAVLGCPPELAYDIDFADDYDYALSHLAVNC